MTTKSLILAGILGIAALSGCTGSTPDGGARTTPAQDNQNAEGSDTQSEEGSGTGSDAVKPAEGSGT